MSLGLVSSSSVAPCSVRLVLVGGGKIDPALEVHGEFAVVHVAALFPTSFIRALFS